MTLVYDRPGFRCLGGNQPGVEVFRDYLMRKHNLSNDRDLGIYNCRPPRLTRWLISLRKSAHAEGRAWDCYFNSYNRLDRLFGEMIVNWAIANADELGLQAIIFNHKQWGFGEWYVRPTSSSQVPHIDHIHFEFNWWAAKNLTNEYLLNLDQGDDELTPEMERLIRETAVNSAETELKVTQLQQHLVSSDPKIKTIGYIRNTYQAINGTRTSILSRIASKVGAVIRG